jgi:S-formylglutathione hydrolase
MTLELVRRHRCFGGTQAVHRHDSRTTGTPMEFSIFLPFGEEDDRARPVLFWLSGLTCTWANFTEKAGAQCHAASHGVILVCPDTSPRGTDLPGEHESYDFGSGAGFYLDATVEPWSRHYRMASYVTDELPELIAGNFNADINRTGIFGHSMGGHGALVAALRNPGQYKSVSAFAPIAAPSRSPWGRKAFSGYLGEDRNQWSAYDASELVQRNTLSTTILIDQGLDDPYLAEQLHPHLFEDACRQANQAIVLRRHQGYDHGYYFIQTFIADHVRHHARQMSKAG